MISNVNKESDLTLFQKKLADLTNQVNQINTWIQNSANRFNTNSLTASLANITQQLTVASEQFHSLTGDTASTVDFTASTLVKLNGAALQISNSIRQLAVDTLTATNIKAANVYGQYSQFYNRAWGATPAGTIIPIALFSINDLTLDNNSIADIKIRIVNNNNTPIFSADISWIINGASIYDQIAFLQNQTPDGSGGYNRPIDQILIYNNGDGTYVLALVTGNDYPATQLRYLGSSTAQVQWLSMNYNITSSTSTSISLNADSGFLPLRLLIQNIDVDTGNIQHFTANDITCQTLTVENFQVTNVSRAFGTPVNIPSSGWYSVLDLSIMNQFTLNRKIVDALNNEELVTMVSNNSFTFALSDGQISDQFAIDTTTKKLYVHFAAGANYPLSYYVSPDGVLLVPGSNPVNISAVATLPSTATVYDYSRWNIITGRTYNAGPFSADGRIVSSQDLRAQRFIQTLYKPFDATGASYPPINSQLDTIPATTPALNAVSWYKILDINDLPKGDITLFNAAARYTLSWNSSNISLFVNAPDTTSYVTQVIREGTALYLKTGTQTSVFNIIIGTIQVSSTATNVLQFTASDPATPANAYTISANQQRADFGYTGTPTDYVIAGSLTVAGDLSINNLAVDVITAATNVIVAGSNVEVVNNRDSAVPATPTAGRYIETAGAKNYVDAQIAANQQIIYLPDQATFLALVAANNLVPGKTYCYPDSTVDNTNIINDGNIANVTTWSSYFVNSKLTNLQSQLNELSLGVIWLTPYDFGTPTPSNNALDNQAYTQRNDWLIASHIPGGVHIVNLNNGAEWVHNGDTNLWINIGVSNGPSAFSNSLAGVILGTNEELAVSNPSTFGTVSATDLNGHAKVNNLFLDTSATYNSTQAGLHFILEAGEY